MRKGAGFPPASSFAASRAWQLLQHERLELALSAPWLSLCLGEPLPEFPLGQGLHLTSALRDEGTSSHYCRLRVL